MRRAFTFQVATLTGFCVAVPHTLSAVPWGGGTGDNETDAVAAQVVLQTLTPQREAFDCCARTVLQSTVRRLQDRGLKPVCAFEMEFHLLQQDANAVDGFKLAAFDELPDAQFMYGLDALAEKAPIFADIRRAAKWAKLPVDTIVKEAGPGQYEVNLNHRDDALRAADDVVLLKRIVRECARRHGLEGNIYGQAVYWTTGAMACMSMQACWIQTTVTFFPVHPVI